MNFAAIYNIVGGNFDANMLDNVKKIVNQSQHEILSVRPWSWRMATSNAVPLVAGQQAYQLTGSSPVIPDFGGLSTVELELVAAGTRRSLASCDPQVFSDITSHNRVSGVPMLYAVRGGAPAATSGAVLSGGNQQLVLSPIPTAAANQGVNVFLSYWRSVGSVEMTADADVPIVPIAHHMAIIDLANYHLYTLIGLGPAAQASGQAVNQRLERMVMEDELVTPPRDNKRLEYARPPTLQEQGHATTPRLALPVPNAA